MQLSEVSALLSTLIFLLGLMISPILYRCMKYIYSVHASYMIKFFSLFDIKRKTYTSITSVCFFLVTLFVLFCIITNPLLTMTIPLLYLVPYIIRLFYLKKRMTLFIYQLPDALSSIASSMKAGASLNKAMEIVAKRQPSPLRLEFSIVLSECGLGKHLEIALSDMYRRMPCQELELFATAINVSRQVGGNLADTLDGLADVLREKANMDGKIKALTAMGRAQGWLVGLLPFGVTYALYQQQPDKMILLFTETYGLITLAVIGFMMIIASWVIYKIVNIDV